MLDNSFKSLVGTKLKSNQNLTTIMLDNVFLTYFNDTLDNIYGILIKMYPNMHHIMMYQNEITNKIAASCQHSHKNHESRLTKWLKVKPSNVKKVTIVKNHPDADFPDECPPINGLFECVYLPRYSIYE